jgi:hypothetical protein
VLSEFCKNIVVLIKTYPKNEGRGEIKWHFKHFKKLVYFYENEKVTNLILQKLPPQNGYLQKRKSAKSFIFFHSLSLLLNYFLSLFEYLQVYLQRLSKYREKSFLATLSFFLFLHHSNKSESKLDEKRRQEKEKKKGKYRRKHKVTFHRRNRIEKRNWKSNCRYSFSFY